jgi:hypothetical protein
MTFAAGAVGYGLKDLQQDILIGLAKVDQKVRGGDT